MAILIPAIGSCASRMTSGERRLAERLEQKLDDDYAQAVEQITQDRSKQIAVNANRELYRLLKEGVKVKVLDDTGAHRIETLRVIDWATPGHNDFFLTSQMWVAGDMYRRRCDLVAFVNGLPLVFIELKKPSVPLKSAYDANLRDYKGQSVPQLFHPNAFILLSNGSDTRVGTLTLRREKLVFDWREKQQTKAAVMQTLKIEMRRLPIQYTKDIRDEKFARAYAHVYDHYFGAGLSAYAGAV